VRSNALKIFSYSKKYWFVFADPSKASLLHVFSRDKRRLVMAALANLAKFLGEYELWQRIVKNAGLKWEKRPSVEVFLGILNTRLSEVEDWLHDALTRLPEKYRAVLIFNIATGLRPSEACMACQLISTLSESDRLSEYLNSELTMLEHFRYPELFLRKSKNCYVSFGPEEVLQLVLQIKPKFPYAALASAIKKRGLPVKTMQLRKLYATKLRQKGIPPEIIDLFQGRIEQSIFLCRYYKPDILADLREKTLKAIGSVIKKVLVQ